MKTACLLPIALTTLFSTNSFSSDEFNYGFYPSIGLYSVNDPEGKTEQKAVFQLIDVFAAYELYRDSRLYLEVALMDEKFEPSISEVGTKIKSTDFTVQYQWRYRVSKSFKPWLGIGGMFSNVKYTNRHLVDRNGYLAKEFEPIEQKETALSVSMMLENEIAFGSIIYGISYKASLDDGRSGVSFNVGLQF